MSDYFPLLLDFLSYREDNPLIFTGWEFWLFFSIFLGGYALVYKRTEIKNPYILFFSLFFYYKSSGWAVLLLLFTITQDFFLAKWMGRNQTASGKKVLVGISIAMNLLVLAYFKYAFLFADFLEMCFGVQIPHYNWIAAVLPCKDLLQLHVDNILLPVGISFFIFHSLSYTIDVYRGIVSPLKSWVDYAVFVSFFPELVAGPIVRARDFTDQLSAPFQSNRQDFGKAIGLILGGLFKKVVISDMLSTGLADKVFEQPELASGIETWFAVAAYAFQIFCDFSGYTDIAIGLALVLGYHLKPNFNEPYKALSITDFWRRWHISLSVWLRDYLYIPLGGNRRGKAMTYINLMITMLLGGLWHGASLKFILWGGLHGSALALHKGWQGLQQKFSLKVPDFIAGFFTFWFVAFCWIPFRAADLNTSYALFRNLWMPWNAEVLPGVLNASALPLSILCIGILLHYLPWKIKEYYFTLCGKVPVWVLGVFCLCMLVLMFQFSTEDSHPFIYFQF